MHILEDLWYGNIQPVARNFRQGTNYADAAKMLCRNESMLLDLLTEKENDLFEKYQDCQKEMTAISECEAFISGFRVGVRMMMDAMSDDGEFEEI